MRLEKNLVGISSMVGFSVEVSSTLMGFFIQSQCRVHSMAGAAGRTTVVAEDHSLATAATINSFI
jgi:two-component sensor histidine kinase